MSREGPEIEWGSEARALAIRRVLVAVGLAYRFFVAFRPLSRLDARAHAAAA